MRTLTEFKQMMVLFIRSVSNSFEKEFINHNIKTQDNLAERQLFLSIEHEIRKEFYKDYSINELASIAEDALLCIRCNLIAMPKYYEEIIVSILKSLLALNKVQGVSKLPNSSSNESIVELSPLYFLSFMSKKQDEIPAPKYYLTTQTIEGEWDYFKPAFQQLSKEEMEGLIAIVQEEQNDDGSRTFVVGYKNSKQKLINKDMYSIIEKYFLFINNCMDPDIVVSKIKQDENNCFTIICTVNAKNSLTSLEIAETICDRIARIRKAADQQKPIPLYEFNRLPVWGDEPEQKYAMKSS